MPKVNNFEVFMAEGIAIQDTDEHIIYDDAYYDKVVSKDNSEISEKVNDFRMKMVESVIERKSAQVVKNVLDFGCGSGHFIKRLKNKHPLLTVMGYDVMQKTRDNLTAIRMFYDFDNASNRRYIDFDIVCFFDSFEHIVFPIQVMAKIPRYVIISIPIFADMRHTTLVRSKHFRPHEHLFCFTKDGLVKFFKKENFNLIDLSSGETDAGREDIVTFVFERKQ